MNDLHLITSRLDGYTSDSLGFEVLSASKTVEGTWILSVIPYKKEGTEGKEGREIQSYEYLGIMIERLMCIYSDTVGFTVVTAENFEGSKTWKLAVKKIEKVKDEEKNCEEDWK